MFDNESSEALLIKIMNSGNYSDDYIRQIHTELDRRRIINASNELLIYQFLFPEKYSAENLINVTNELKRRGIDSEKFDDSTYIDCVVSEFPIGWKNTLKEMFQELKENGWNSGNKLNYNFSFGSITIEDLENNDNQILREIIEKYKLHNTCCNCSSEKNIESFEDEFLCQACILDIIIKREITEISDDGFKFYNFPTYSNETGKYDVIKWKDIKQISITININNHINIELNKLSQEEENNIAENLMQSIIINHVSFSSNFNINFFELLKKIPKNKLTKEQSIDIDNILNNITQCIICKKNAMLYDNCLLCGENLLVLKNPSKSALKRFGTNEIRIQHEKQNFLEWKDKNFFLKYRYENDKSYN